MHFSYEQNLFPFLGKNAFCLLNVPHHATMFLKNACSRSQDIRLYNFGPIWVQIAQFLEKKNFHSKFECYFCLFVYLFVFHHPKT